MMEKKLYFLSGLPRSGSTVLAAILNQNPLIHATSTSGLIDLIGSVYSSWYKSPSIQASVYEKENGDEKLKVILKNICQTKYHEIKKPIILDKSRSWANNEVIPTMYHVLGYKPKIIATVRNVEDCVASMVRVAKPENLSEFLKNSPLVSYVKDSYINLHNAHNFFRECIFYVEYDDLIKNPIQVLQNLHSFLEIEKYDYDLNKIDASLVLEKDEEIWSVPGLHDIDTVLRRQHSQKSSDVLQHWYSKFVQPRFWRGETKSNLPPHKLDLMLSEGLAGNLDSAERIGNELSILEPLNDRVAFNRGWYVIRRGHLLDGHILLNRGRNEEVFGNKFPDFQTPMWDGKSKGTVLLNLEGGLGDQIHGAGMIRYIVNRGCSVIVACSGPLATLFVDIPGVKAVVQHEAAFGVVHDFWVPGMSVIIPLQLEYKDVDGSPYITRPKLIRGKRMRIGLRWQGSPSFEHDQHRLFPSKLLFDAVQGFEDVDFISLQRDDGSQYRPDWVKEVSLDHWEQTRHAIASCDLVISSCTSVAHLSAAMGIETWIVIPALPYYLWATPGNKTKWYDSVVLFRQKKYGEWSFPFTEINERLTKKLGGSYANTDRILDPSKQRAS